MSLIGVVGAELQAWSTPGWSSADIEARYGAVVGWQSPNVAVCRARRSDWGRVLFEFSSPPPARPLGIRVELSSPQPCNTEEARRAFGKPFREIADMDAWGRPSMYVFRTTYFVPGTILLIRAAEAEPEAWLVSSFILRWAPSPKR